MPSVPKRHALRVRARVCVFACFLLVGARGAEGGEAEGVEFIWGGLDGGVGVGVGRLEGGGGIDGGVH